MKNKLFITCPFSSLELPLQKKYGQDILFMTASGGVLQYQDYDYIEAIKDTVEREKIDTIYIVNDTSCLLINRIINKEELFGLASEKALLELYIDHFTSDFEGRSIEDQQCKLAELNILEQANELRNSMLLGDYITENNIEIIGLVSSKENKRFREVKITRSHNEVYEF